MIYIKKYKRINQKYKRDAEKHSSVLMTYDSGRKTSAGFTLFYAVLISSLLLAVGIAIFNITYKELILSSGARESQSAFYAADSALECALFWDLKHTGSSNSPFGFYGDSLRSGLLGYWRFEEGSGSSVALDYSGSNNHGALTNMNSSTAWVSGHTGGGLLFDGVNDVVVTPDIDYANSATESLWVYFNNVSAQQMLIGQGTTFETQLLMQGAAGGGKFRIRVDTATGSDIADSTTAALAGQWYHVLWTYNGTDVTLYINGAAQTNFTLNTGSGAILDANQDYGIGGRTIGTLPTNGIIDDVRIYNRALSSQEIQALYQGKPNNQFVAPVAQGSGIPCIGVDITNPANGWDTTSGWTVTSGAQSATTIFDLSFPNGRCATVQVDKTTLQTTIVSRGYNTCSLTDLRRVERAIRAVY